MLELPYEQAYAAAITTNIKNYKPTHRGKIIGFMGSCVALSSAVFSFIYSVGFSRNLGQYLLFAGLFAGSVTFVLGTLFMNQLGVEEAKQIEKEEQNGKDDDDVSFVHDEDLDGEDVEHLNDFLMLDNEGETFSLSFFPFNYFQKKQEEVSGYKHLNNEVADSNKLEITGDESINEEESIEQNYVVQDITTDQEALEEREEEIEEQAEQAEIIENEIIVEEQVRSDLIEQLDSFSKKDIDEQIDTKKEELKKRREKLLKIAQTPIPDANPIQILFSLDFYLVFYIYFAAMGSGLVIVNNLGSLVISLGGEDGQQHLMVMFFSFSNAIGRLVFGLLSDSFSRFVTRTTFLTGSVILMLITQLIVLVSPLWTYYVILILLGISFGGTAVMVPSFLSERFGPRYFAVNSSICSLASSLGSFLLATLLAGKVYESHIQSTGSKICYGYECFELTFYLTTVMCVLASAAGLVLMYRTRGLYRILYYRKYFNMNADPAMVK